MTPDEFRQLLPEFDDPVKYPDVRIAMYLGIAPQWVDADRWGLSATLGTALFVAHYLTWASLKATDATPRGALTSKKVGDVSNTFADAGSAADAGWWNSTKYGRQWWDLKGRLAGPAVLHLI